MQIVFVSFLLGDHRLRWQRWQGEKKNVLANQTSHFLQKIKDFVMTHRKEKNSRLREQIILTLADVHVKLLPVPVWRGREGMNVFHFQNEFMSP